MASKAVPVASTTLAGSGAMVTHADYTWLVTCSHILTGVMHAPPDWAKWQRTLTAVLQDGDLIEIEAFDASGEPAFRWAHDGITGKMVEDIIAFRLDNTQTERLIGYVRFPLFPSSLSGGGQHVDYAGYPGFGQTYPKAPPEVCSSAFVTGSGNQMLGLSVVIDLGFSGGPVTWCDRLIGIMSGNQGDDGYGALVVDVSTVKAETFD